MFNYKDLVPMSENDEIFNNCVDKSDSKEKLKTFNHFTSFENVYNQHPKYNIELMRLKNFNNQAKQEIIKDYNNNQKLQLTNNFNDNNPNNNEQFNYEHNLNIYPNFLNKRNIQFEDNFVNNKDNSNDFNHIIINEVHSIPIDDNSNFNEQNFNEQNLEERIFKVGTNSAKKNGIIISNFLPNKI